MKRMQEQLRHGALMPSDAIPVPIIGQLRNMRNSLIARVFYELNLKPVAPKDAPADSKLGYLWMCNIYGSNYDFSADIEMVKQRSPDIHIVNNTHFTDDKLVVEQEFEKAFGYALGIDPLTHVGKALTKSRINARHDGAIIDTPIAKPNPEAVYERLIDNVTDDGRIEEVRVTVVNFEPVHLHVKIRKIDDRFVVWNNDHSHLAPLDEIYSADELSRMAAFTRGIGLECGELDVLRDRESGKIYIIDANNTPYGPTGTLTDAEKAELLRDLAASFAKAYNVGSFGK